MSYDIQKTQKVLEGILETAKQYDKQFPRLWGVYDLPETISGLPVISHMKNPDAYGPTTFVEIRRESDGLFRYYDRFDGEAQASSPKRIAEKLGIEGAAGWMSSERFTPKHLIGH